jgi:hypothetical protein
MSNAVVNVSFYAGHAKGGDGINYLPGEEHWRWLEQCLLYLEELCDWPLFVSMTGFAGFETTDAAPHNNERDVLWRIFSRPRVRLITMAANPGHQVGAAWCIWLGAQAAAKLGIDYMIHTAEDIVPRPGAMQQMVRQLEEGATYVGEVWHTTPPGLSTQFFACRAGSVAGPLDPCRVREYGFVERALWELVPEHLRRINEWAETHRTCHDFSVWSSWVREQREPS